MLKRAFIGCLILLVGVPIWSQTPVAPDVDKNKAKIFVSNNFVSNGKMSVCIKWILKEVSPIEGAHVYRADAGKNNWMRVSTFPLIMLPQKPDTMKLSEESKAFYNKALTTTDPKGRSLLLAFAASKAIADNNLAYVLGMYYVDETAIEGRKYQYKVVTLDKGKEVDRAISSEIKVGKWKQIDPIDNLTFKRGPDAIGLNWTPEPQRYFGVNVYRAESKNGLFKKLNTNPLSITMNKTTGKYPEYLYLDYKSSKDSVYYYKVVGVDFFGQPTEESDIVKAGKVDLIPPWPAFALDYKIDTLKVRVKWNYMLDSVPDLMNLRVYRASKYEGPFTAVSKKLPRTDTVYHDNVPMPGEYFYYISAYDSTGNETQSSKMFVDVRDVVPPVMPSNFTVRSDTGKMVFAWKMNKEKDLAGYYIYKAIPGQEDNMIVINKTPIKAITYIEKMSKKISNKFIYSLVAVDSAGNRSLKTPFVTVKLPDVTPPSKPFIKGIDNTDNGLTIRWMPNTDPDLSHYRLVRRLKSDDKAPMLQIGENISKIDTLLIDASAQANTLYLYALVAIDSAGNSSMLSSGFSAKLIKQSKGIPIEKFEAVFNKKKEQVDLNWRVNTKNNFNGCVVYRRAKKEDDAIPVTGMLNSQFDQMDYTDDSAKPGLTYIYHVRSYSKDGITTLSDEIEVDIPKKK